jgi:hypothetical protein
MERLLDVARDLKIGVVALDDHKIDVFEAEQLLAVRD